MEVRRTVGSTWTAGRPVWNAVRVSRKEASSSFVIKNSTAAVAWMYAWLIA